MTIEMYLVLTLWGLVLIGSLICTIVALKRRSVVWVVLSLLLSGFGSLMGMFGVWWVNILFILQLFIAVLMVVIVTVRRWLAK